MAACRYSLQLLCILWGCCLCSTPYIDVRAGIIESGQESRTLLVGRKCLQALLHRGRYKSFVLSSAVRVRDIQAAARQEKIAFGVQVDDLISQIKALCVRQRGRLMRPDMGHTRMDIPYGRVFLQYAFISLPAFLQIGFLSAWRYGLVLFSSEIWMQSRPSGCTAARCISGRGGVVREKPAGSEREIPSPSSCHFRVWSGEETAGVVDG